MAVGGFEKHTVELQTLAAPLAMFITQSFNILTSLANRMEVSLGWSQGQDIISPANTALLPHVVHATPHTDTLP
jgi:hypothetical protein